MRCRGRIARHARPPAPGARRRRVQRRVRHRAAATTPGPFHWWVDIVPRLGVDGGLRARHRRVGEHRVAAPTRPPRAPRGHGVSIRVGITIDAPPARRLAHHRTDRAPRRLDGRPDVDHVHRARPDACRHAASTACTTSDRSRRRPHDGHRVGAGHGRWASNTTAWSPGRGRFTLRRRPHGRTRFTWTEQLTFPWWMGGAVRRARGQARAPRCGAATSALKQLVERRWHPRTHERGTA